MGRAATDGMAGACGTVTAAEEAEACAGADVAERVEAPEFEAGVVGWNSESMASVRACDARMAALWAGVEGAGAVSSTTVRSPPRSRVLRVDVYDVAEDDEEYEPDVDVEGRRLTSDEDTSLGYVELVDVRVSRTDTGRYGSMREPSSSWYDEPYSEYPS